MKDPEPTPKKRLEAAPDLQTQLEALLDQVWDCEAEWRFDDLLAIRTRGR